ncbi:hypothetical protein M9H77_30885 [Catharanthus roseus]|uniref:Uncharacterized protein n=1 Tax=Catharanthus roseus TaxID=4058 RepID=A0ACB9ZYH3_CATRO|nr:hypothetical protein M9H77_30885 [Catharanthus roseus]
MSKVVGETFVDTQCMIINRDMDSKCENRRRIGAQPIKTWSLMKQALRIRFGVANYERQIQDQPKSLKIDVMEETSKEDPCCIMNEKSIGIKEKQRVEEKESKKEEQRLKDIFILERVRKSIAMLMKLPLSLLVIPYELKKMKKELGAILEELPLFLEFYLSHVSIIGAFCVISFSGGLFLVVSYVSKCLSSYAFLENSLLHSGSMFDPSCYDLGVMNNASIESIVVGFVLDDAFFDILLDKYLGKFVKLMAMFPLSLILLWRIIMILIA